MSKENKDIQTFDIDKLFAGTGITFREVTPEELAQMQSPNKMKEISESGEEIIKEEF